jgi:ATP-binding cassette subfamily F protein 3
VSHDRYFINQTATRILELVSQTFVNYIGNYDYYLEKKDELTKAYASSGSSSTVPSNGKPLSAGAAESVSEGKLSWQEQKELQAKERKRQNELKKTEERIAALEDRNTEIDELMTRKDIYSNSVKCQELSLEKAEKAKELEELYERWEELASI